MLNAVRSTEDGWCLDYYEAGTVKAGGLQLQITTNYPADGNVLLTVLEAPREQARLKLRIPAFSKHTALTVNGEAQPVSAGYTSLERCWQPGDQIALTLNMALRLLRPLGMEGQLETLQYLALEYGPLTLARDARLSSMGDPVESADSASLTVLTQREFPAIFRCRVQLGTQQLELVNYSAAGKTWDQNSLTECWLKTR